MNKKKLRYLIIFLIIALITLELYNSTTSKYTSRIFYKIKEQFEPETIQDYNRNIQGEYYRERMAYFNKNSKQEYDVVLLGNSLIEAGNWDSLLHDFKILNYGIGGDITLGMLNRLDLIIKINPKVCFIEGGVNDLYRNIPEDSIVTNIRKMQEILVYNNIQVVNIGLTFVGKDFENASELNNKISSLNNQIKLICEQNKCKYLDLNNLLSSNGFLKPDYTYDQLHYTDSAYSIVAAEIRSLLKKN